MSWSGQALSSFLKHDAVESDVVSIGDHQRNLRASSDPCSGPAIRAIQSSVEPHGWQGRNTDERNE